MALAAQFIKGLRKLFDRRTARLRAVIGKKKSGPLPAFTKKKVNPQLEHLKDVARQILLKNRRRKEFKDSVVSRKQWRINKSKGWGRPEKKRNFRRWYEREIRSHNCVYIFWSGPKCEYVGRTVRGKGRPTSAFDKYWFNGVTRIDIYSIKSPAIVPKAECLAIDVFDPRRNINSSSRPKYSRKCPICSSERTIRRELKRIFSFRRKRRKKVP